MTDKKCAKCGTPFECAHPKEGCWCEDLFLDMDTLRELKEKYDNCLCPPCLKEYSNKSIKK